MTNPNVDPAVALGGENANSTPSQAPAASVEGDAKAQELLFRKIAQEEARKAADSTKDKRFNEVQEFMAEFKKYKANGLSDDDAEAAVIKSKAESEDKQLLRLIAEKVLGSSSPNPSVAQVVPASAAAQALVSAMELNANDPDVARVLAEEVDVAKLAAKLANVKVSKANQPSPTPAQSAAPVGGTAPSDDVAALTEKYKESMRAHRGKPSELAAIRADYLKKGVNVYGIDFT